MLFARRNATVAGDMCNRLTVVFDVDGDSPRGEVRVEGEANRTFTGWLELIAMLEDVMRPGAGRKERRSWSSRDSGTA